MIKITVVIDDSDGQLKVAMSTETAGGSGEFECGTFALVTSAIRQAIEGVQTFPGFQSTTMIDGEDAKPMVEKIIRGGS